MLIRNPAKEEKSKLKEMYLDIFDDTALFVDYYFESRYDEGSVLVTDNDNGEIMSMLSRNARHFLLYTEEKQERILKEKLDARYIYAVATKVEHRGKGLVKAMLSESEKFSLEEGTDFEFLIPVNARYYASSGYVLVREKEIKKYFRPKTNKDYEGRKEDILKEKYKEIIVNHKTSNLDEIIEELVGYDKEYCEYLAHNGKMVLARKRDKEYFNTMIMQHIVEKGYIYVLKDEEGIAGYAVVINETKPELQFVSALRVLEEEIATKIAVLEGVEELEYKINPIMIKPINNEARKLCDKIKSQNTITLYFNEEV